jgi:hypothetical protein
MKKLTLLLLIALPILLLTALPILATAQASPSSEKAAVVQVVQQFFTTMQQRDTATAKNITLTNCQLYSIQQTKDSIITRMRTFADFLQVVAQKQLSLEEKMWNPTVMVHNQLAIVWAPYDFHLNGKLTHCGIDVFNLLKTSTGWKISGVQYTVEPDACTVLQKTN